MRVKLKVTRTEVAVMKWNPRTSDYGLGGLTDTPQWVPSSYLNDFRWHFTYLASLFHGLCDFPSSQGWEPSDVLGSETHFPSYRRLSHQHGRPMPLLPPQPPSHCIISNYQQWPGFSFYPGQPSTPSISATSGLKIFSIFPPFGSGLGNPKF